MADERVLDLQKQQLRYNGAVTLSLMNRIEPRGRIVASGKAISLKYDVICSNMEGKSEIPKGGYVVATKVTKEEVQSTVFKEEQLPSFTKESRDADADLKYMKNESRLHVTPLGAAQKAIQLREAAGGVPVLVKSCEPSGKMALTAQGELEMPIPLKKLSSFFVEWSVKGKGWQRVGPFSKQEIHKRFSDECNMRKKFAADGRGIDVTLLMSPHAVHIEKTGQDGDYKVLFNLVRHNSHTCLLGVIFFMEVEVGDLPPQEECCICLEECQSSEWSCVNCKNVMHHSCRETLLGSKITACPYCRHDDE